MCIVPANRLRQIVIQAVADILGCAPAEISDESAVDVTSGWDSLQHLSVMMTLEEELGVRIEPEDFVENKTVAAIVDLFSRLTSQSGSRDGEQ